jgi:hypothetical protein
VFNAAASDHRRDALVSDQPTVAVVVVATVGVDLQRPSTGLPTLATDGWHRVE